MMGLSKEKPFGFENQIRGSGVVTDNSDHLAVVSHRLLQVIHHRHKFFLLKLRLVMKGNSGWEFCISKKLNVVTDDSDHLAVFGHGLLQSLDHK